MNNLTLWRRRLCSSDFESLDSLSESLSLELCLRFLDVFTFDLFFLCFLLCLAASGGCCNAANSCSYGWRRWCRHAARHKQVRTMTSRQAAGATQGCISRANTLNISITVAAGHLSLSCLRRSLQPVPPAQLLAVPLQPLLDLQSGMAGGAISSQHSSRKRPSQQLTFSAKSCLKACWVAADICAMNGGNLRHIVIWSTLRDVIAKHGSKSRQTSGTLGLLLCFGMTPDRQLKVRERFSIESFNPTWVGSTLKAAEMSNEKWGWLRLSSQD